MKDTPYYLSIAGTDNLQRGVHKAVLFYDTVTLVLSQHNQEIHRANLSPNRVSFHITQQETEDKIALLYQRLNIDASLVIYDKSPLSSVEALYYKSLFIAKMLYKMLIPMQWVIVYKRTNGQETWHKIIPPKEVFQADPFIIAKDNKYYVFYEELKFADYQGYLAVAELDLEQGKLINAKTILKQDYHLSYPQVFEENQQFYMIPESADNHSIDLYECTNFPYQWRKKQVLIDAIEAVDSTLLKHEGAWYLFTNEKVKGANYDDELSIYKTTDLFRLPFKKLYQHPVINDVRNARMAGQFIRRKDGLFRVSQDGGKRYGYRANLNKVLEIEGGYKEQKMMKIAVEKRALGFHTYNEAQGVAVGDQLIARFDYYSLKRFIGGNLKRVLFS